MSASAPTSSGPGPQQGQKRGFGWGGPPEPQTEESAAFLAWQYNCNVIRENMKDNQEACEEMLDLENQRICAQIVYITERRAKRAKCAVDAREAKAASLKLVAGFLCDQHSKFFELCVQGGEVDKQAFLACLEIRKQLEGLADCGAFTTEAYARLPGVRGNEIEFSDSD